MGGTDTVGSIPTPLSVCRNAQRTDGRLHGGVDLGIERLGAIQMLLDGGLRASDQ
jgi:hypothetical protein